MKARKSYGLRGTLDDSTSRDFRGPDSRQVFDAVQRIQCSHYTIRHGVRQNAPHHAERNGAGLSTIPQRQFTDRSC